MLIHAHLVVAAWGVHVSASSKWSDASELEHATYAVSRLGSGSHLMAMVDAQQRGWSAEALKFEIVGNLQGARSALAEGKADAFMWEKFTTKHLVDSGEWRRIGEVLTPWPCFSLAATDKARFPRDHDLSASFHPLRDRLI